MKVEVLYFSDCPNHAPAVSRVREVLQQEGTAAELIEVEVKDTVTAQRLGFLGSPSIRIDGQDIEPAVRTADRFGMMCRTYVVDGRPAGVPPPELIRDAVREARGDTPLRRLTERVTPVAAALSALATLACCLPLGIAGGVGALGLSVALASLRPWLIGLAIVFLAIGSWQLYRGARTCRRRSPLSLVLFGLSAAVVVGVVLFPQKVAEMLAALP